MTNFEIAKRVFREKRESFIRVGFFILVMLALKFGTSEHYARSRYGTIMELYIYLALPGTFIREFLKMKKSLKNK